MPAVALTVYLSATIVCLGPEPLLKSYDTQTLSPDRTCVVVEPDKSMPVTPTEIFMVLPNGLYVMTGYDSTDTDVYWISTYNMLKPKPPGKVKA
jgi:hypothetical protein